MTHKASITTIPPAITEQKIGVEKRDDEAEKTKLAFWILNLEDICTLRYYKAANERISFKIIVIIVYSIDLEWGGEIITN